MEGRGAGDAVLLGDVAPKLVELGHHVVIAKPCRQQQRPIVRLILRDTRTHIRTTSSLPPQKTTIRPSPKTTHASNSS